MPGYGRICISSYAYASRGRLGFLHDLSTNKGNKQNKGHKIYYVHTKQHINT